MDIILHFEIISLNFESLIVVVIPRMFENSSKYLITFESEV